MTEQLPALCDRAAAGAKFLDEKEPGWEKRIKITHLDLGSPFRCVLGQLDGYFTTGMDRYGLDHEGASSVYALGFDNEDDGDDCSPRYAALTNCWKDEIRARRKQPKEEPMTEGQVS